MQRSVIRWTVSLLTASLVLSVLPSRLDAAPKPPVPDLTRGGKPDDTHDWTLGPTGARGWIWGWRGHTTDARQIRVTVVDPKSPADGILEKGDVILGIDGKPFAGDARMAFARGIGEAESGRNRGVLRLLRWRKGKTKTADLPLPVLGSYSRTAPYDCPKSRRIFEQGCRAIASRDLERISIPNALNALVLLASGQSEYRPIVVEYARKVADHQPGGHVTWGYAYQTLFLAEYAIATKDPSVNAGLKRLALDIARGQNAVGTWGHAFARPDGRLNGYGAMNQPGIVLTIAMAVSRKAGVKAPELDEAIGKSARFLRWYAGKGAIPYGDHAPWPWHDDNGKCSSGAVLFDLLGVGEAAGFFARMGAAAHGERESGHTGNFFNLLWALPGVARCGPHTTGAYLEEASWLYDLARRWDGTYVYQGVPGDRIGNYRGWDSTGAYLLAYALPLKSLCITGRKSCSAKPLSRNEADEVIAAGRDFSFWNMDACYDTRDTEALFKGLASWSPTVRKRSAKALSHREGDFVPRLLKLLDREDDNAHYGACEALGLLGPRADKAAPLLRDLLSETDPWLLSLAVQALARMGPEVRKTITPDLLRLTARTNPADPRKMVQRATGVALFSPMPGKREPKPILAQSLDGVDRALLYPAIETILENDDAATRGLLKSAYTKLSDGDIAALLPVIVKAVEQSAPSDVMFADGIRLAGLDLLSRLHIREGMPLCVELMEPDRWGASRRIPGCIKYLGRYGGNAKTAVGRLRDVRETVIRKDRRQREKNPQAVAIEQLIAAIEKDENPPRLTGVDEFVSAHK